MINNLHYEYLALISPTGQVHLDTSAMKVECKIKYGWSGAVWSRPHITLFNVVQPEFVEQKLINKCIQVARCVSSFQVELSGFDHFTGPTYAIYVKVQNAKQVSDISRHVENFSRPILRKAKDCPLHFSSKPHLTIAKGISKSDFINIWPEWKDRNYSGTFNAEGIILLRRPISYIPGKYEVIGDYPFLGKGVLNHQITLF